MTEIGDKERRLAVPQWDGGDRRRQGLVKVVTVWRTPEFAGEGGHTLSYTYIMMSENAIRDLNFLPKSESSSKDIFAKPYVEHSVETVENKQRTNMGSLVQSPVNGNELGVAEVEYIESEKLDDLEDVDKNLKMLVLGLESKDWVLICETLNNVRRFSIYHKEALQDILERVISLVVKSLKNPRSALVQLLLKSSQDKRFVCEAAEKALVALTTWVSAVLLLPKLQPYLKNRNPRIRAKASTCFSRSVPRLDAEEMKAYGIEKLIEIGASQLSDQLPESREAARALLLDLQAAYENSPVLAPESHSEVHSWEQFCELNLSKSSAQAVLRVTSVGREGVVSVS
ncbi:Armadillo-like helical [Cynara cardunculus var. scolymus]|uniref:Armadillo-like helical n=1 Tax=Cynara cardunculus var. scolymus TaxID=59895 RepID=A0A118K5I8_CYNCS|nr:Armadillo-like helical [Cynara cardunculus var. scolymus]